MSFSCPFDDAGGGASAIPCEKDLVVKILRDLLGDNYVDAFLISGKSPALATMTEPTVLSMTLSLLASVAITAAILIFVVSIYKWVTESANDGEAVGLSERGGILGMFGRPFFALALLVPTASGYPTINLIIMTVVLWANGATNQLYKTVSDSKINVLNIDSTFKDSEVFKQANDVTDAYVVGAAQGYCIAQLMGTGSNILARNKFTGTNPEYPTNTPTSKVSYSDTGSWFLSKSRDVCGSFDTELYTLGSVIGDPSNKLAKSDIYEQIEIIQKTQAAPIRDIVNLRRGYAALAYLRGMNESLGSENLNKVFGGSGGTVNTSFLSSKLLGDNKTPLASSSIPPSKGWDLDMTADQLENPANIKLMMDQAFATSKSLHENAVRIVDNQILGNGGYIGAIENAGNAISASLLSSGWMNAGNAQSTLRQLKNGAVNKINTKPYTVTYALGFSAEEVAENDEKGVALTRIQAISDAINKGVLENLPKNHPAQVTLVSQIMQADVEKGGDGANMANNMASTLAAPYHSMNTTLIKIIVNENSTDDTLTRIQNFGEWLLMIIGATLTAIILIKVGLMMSKVAAATAAGLTFGVAGGAEAAATSASDLINDILLSPLGELLDTFFLLSRIFGVVIPSMPYIFLILAGIGWFVQIIQTMFGMPLWLIMHSIPEKSFIGSQQQGYVTLLSMLFRPILIISGFYVAFDLYDPLVIFATRAFFDTYGTLSGASSNFTVSEFFIYFGSIKYWYFLYAGVLMSITYLIFGLVQELSDSVLDWLGTNLLRGFGNMDSKSTVQGISGSMAASSKAGRGAIANRMKARSERTGTRDGNAPKTAEERAAADAAVAAVRTSNIEGGNAASTDSAEGVVGRRVDADVTGADALSTTVHTDETDNPSNNNETGLLRAGSSAASADRDVTDSGSEINGDILSDDQQEEGVITNQSSKGIGDDSTETGSSKSSSAADNIVGTSSSAGAAAGVVGGLAAGALSNIGTPSLASNNALAAVAGASGLLAGKALSGRSGGLSGSASNGKGNVTSTSDGGFAVSGLGANGDITARGSVTDDGYSAQLFQNQNGQEVNVGQESVSAQADGSSVTATSVSANGDSTSITTDANNNVLNQEQITTLDNGSTQTQTQDNIAGTDRLSVETPDGAVFEQTSDLASGAVLQTRESSADGAVTNTVDYTPTGGSNSVATASTLHDSVTGATRENTFDPQGQSTRSTTIGADGSSMTVGVANSAIDSSGNVVPVVPITPFMNNNPPSSDSASGTVGGSGGGTPYGSFTRTGSVAGTGGINTPTDSATPTTNPVAPIGGNIGGTNVGGTNTTQGDISYGQAATIGAAGAAAGFAAGNLGSGGAQQSSPATPQSDVSYNQQGSVSNTGGINAPTDSSQPTSRAAAPTSTNVSGTTAPQANVSYGQQGSVSSTGGINAPTDSSQPTSRSAAPTSTNVSGTTAPQANVSYGQATTSTSTSNVVPITQGRQFSSTPLTQSLAREAATNAVANGGVQRVGNGGYQQAAPSNRGVNTATPVTAPTASMSAIPAPASNRNLGGNVRQMQPTTSVTTASPTSVGSAPIMRAAPTTNVSAMPRATSNVTAASPTSVGNAPIMRATPTTNVSAMPRATSNVTAAAPMRQSQFTAAPRARNVGAPSRVTPSVRQVNKASTLRTQPSTQTTAPTQKTSGDTGATPTPSNTNTYTPVITGNSNVSDSGSRVVNRTAQIEGFQPIDEDESITSTKGANKKPSTPPPE